MLLVDGHVQSRAAVLVGAVDLGVLLEQEFGDLGLIADLKS